MSFNDFNSGNPVVQITSVAKSISVNSFSVESSKVILDEKDNAIFYVEITQKNVTGKKWVSNKRVKRQGKEYKLKFMVENKTTGKKLVKQKTSFIEWNDLEISQWKLEREFIVGDYHFELKVTS